MTVANDEKALSMEQNLLFLNRLANELLPNKNRKRENGLGDGPVLSQSSVI